MAIALKLGTVTKKVNSTLVPDATLWTNYDVALKQDTSLEAPVFVLQASTATLAGYNYAVGAGLLYGFYWIVDVVATAYERCEVHCVRDVLANNKTAIMAQSAFIEYGFNTFDAGDSTYKVTDHRQTISQTPTQYHTNADITGGIISTTGQYVLQAVAQNLGVVSYVLNSGTLEHLMQSIGSSIANDVATIRNSTASPDAKLAELACLDVERSLLQDTAIKAIQSCFWLPINRLPLTPATNIYLGNWDTGRTAARLTNDSVYSVTTSMTIPWPVNDWRRNNCQLVLYLPFMGTVPIPVDQCIGLSSISITWSLEYYSGNIAVTVKAGNYTVYTGNANIAASVAIGRSAVNTGNYIAGSIQAIGGDVQMAGGIIDATAGAMGIATSTASAGLLSGAGSLTGGINTMVSGAGNIFSGYAQTIQPAITCAGSMSGLAGAGQPLDADLCLMYYPPLDDAGFSAVYGHPVMKVATPVAGFCKTRGFSLAVADRMGDIASVNAAMDGGVFIE